MATLELELSVSMMSMNLDTIVSCWDFLREGVLRFLYGHAGGGCPVQPLLFAFHCFPYIGYW